MITYVRRIVKSPSNTSLTDSLIIDYINRFWINDVDPFMQLFDFKKTYQFMTIPGFDKYNIPYYANQIESPAQDPQTIASYPMYQGFFSPCSILGQPLRFLTEKNLFYNYYPDYSQYYPSIEQGTGVADYSIQIPSIGNQSSYPPHSSVLLRGHVDTSETTTAIPTFSDASLGIIVKTPNLESKVFVSSQLASTSAPSIYVDSGYFYNNDVNIGALVTKDLNVNGYTIGNSGAASHSTVNYVTGEIEIKGKNLNGPINVQCSYAQTGIPRAVLFYDNTLTLRPVPDNSYAVNIEAYLTPAAFINSSSYMPFGYMNEYIARGAARKIMADTGDQEQLQFNEPFFKEQQILVWKRSQRQWTSTRTQTIYSQGTSGGISNSTYGGNN